MRLLTAKEIAENLRVSKYRAYELLRDGALPVVRVGRLVRVREEDLRAFVETRTVAAAARGGDVT